MVIPKYAYLKVFSPFVKKPIYIYILSKYSVIVDYTVENYG